MEEFEKVLEEYQPMISSVLRKAHVYKNHEHFRQCATIALWQAWQKYDPDRGPFAPYAYRSMLTTVYTEMKKDNRYADHQIPYEKDKLTNVAQFMDLKNKPHNHLSTFEYLSEILKEEEIQLILELYYYQYTYDELSEKYGASTAALRKRRDRILKKIRESIK